MAVSKIDLGRLNTIVAMAIAVTKAVLVVLFFMHVRYSTRLTKLVVVSAFMWLALLLGVTMIDYLTRGWPGREQVFRKWWTAGSNPRPQRSPS